MVLDGRKKYYSTSEVAELLAVEDYILRHWEKEFSQLRPRKNRNGTRRYTRSDIELLQKIQYLMHVERYTTEGARIRLDQIRNIPLARYKNLTTLVYDTSFWEELEAIAQLL